MWLVIWSFASEYLVLVKNDPFQSHISPFSTFLSWAGNHTLNDIYGPYGLNADIFNVQPALGFYCFYRARPGDVPPFLPSPPLRDCINISGTAMAHAGLSVPC